MSYISTLYINMLFEWKSTITGSIKKPVAQITF